MVVIYTLYFDILQLVGVWIYNEWYKLGSPKPLQLVELGPGRGTLMHDILKVRNNDVQLSVAYTIE